MSTPFCCGTVKTALAIQSIPKDLGVVQNPYETQLPLRSACQAVRQVAFGPWGSRPSPLCLLARIDTSILMSIGERKRRVASIGCHGPALLVVLGAGFASVPGLQGSRGEQHAELQQCSLLTGDDSCSTT